MPGPVTVAALIAVVITGYLLSRALLNWIDKYDEDE